MSIREDSIAQQDAMLRYYFKVDTDQISDEKFCELVVKLNWILKEKNKGNTK